MSHRLLIELRAVGALPTAVEFFPVLSSLKASAGRPHLSLARSLSASVVTVTLTAITAWAEGEECVTVRVDTSSQSNGLTLRFRHAFHRSLPPMMMRPLPPPGRQMLKNLRFLMTDNTLRRRPQLDPRP